MPSEGKQAIELKKKEKTTKFAGDGIHPKKFSDATLSRHPKKCISGLQFSQNSVMV